MRAVPLLVALIVMGGCLSGTTDPATTSTQNDSEAPTSVPTTSSAPGTSTITSVTTSTTVPTTTSTLTTSLAGATIVIDPGHNGMNWAHPDEIGRLVDIGNGTKPCNTTGTSTLDGYTEAEFNWAVAEKLVPLLEAAGTEVVLTRTDNRGWGPCITERAATGNRHSADAVISIHADGGPEDGRGFHVIYPATIPGLTDDIAEVSRRLAEALHSSYRTTGMPPADYIGESGLSERDDLGGLNLSDVPVVFLEAGNMRHPGDAALLVDEEFQSAVARAVVDAVTAFLGD